jgi:KaiC/GvpD/RAD55 family RecA-like ATPase
LGQQEERIRMIDTGFAEFDRKIAGGFPRPGIVYIIGNPGVGKTTMALQYLVYRAKKGERGLYITTAEPSESIKYRFSQFSFYKELVEMIPEKIDIQEHLPVLGHTPTDIDMLVKKIFAATEATSFKNIVIDSIASLSSYLSLQDVRTMLTQLMSGAYEYDATLILIDELPLFSQVPHTAIGEFLSDILILMDYVMTKTGRRITTRFTLIKSRISASLREPYVVQVEPPDGFQFIGPLSEPVEKIF